MKLSQYLLREDLRPTEFAARMNKPASTITRLLNGERRGTLALLEEIAVATKGEVTPNDFMGSSEANSNETAQ